MANNKKLTAGILKDWLNTIPPCDRDEVFGAIYTECLITPSTLSNWRYGRAKIPLSGMRDLNKVSQRYSGHPLYEIDMAALTAQ